LNYIELFDPNFTSFRGLLGGGFKDCPEVEGENQGSRGVFPRILHFLSHEGSKIGLEITSKNTSNIQKQRFIIFFVSAHCM
jgi:hypothetical protein